MAEFVFGVIGATIGVVGLVLTFAGYRHQQRQTRELDARETQLRTREREAERREASTHASMLRVEVSKHSSALDPSVSLWRITVRNASSQPFVGVVLRYDDQALESPTLSGHLNPGASTTDTLPVAEGEPDPTRCVVEFTDVAGRLWRRRATGDLRLGHRGPDGQIYWDGEPYVIHAHGLAAGMARRLAPQSSIRPGCLLPETVLILAVVGYVVWHFAHR
ncbi:hypothetical protein [Streptomyces sp. NPDC092129]|uniref:hypothetical protein n=1 Tax=Streptomyces sp. NPDC092129 TaxID=3366010 RepID=UPI00380139DF